MPEIPTPEKHTHQIRVSFCIPAAGVVERTFGWVEKPKVQRMTGDGLTYVPDPTGDQFVEGDRTLEVRYAHGGKTVIQRGQVLSYAVTSVAREKAERKAFDDRMADADARLTEAAVERRRMSSQGRSEDS